MGDSFLELFKVAAVENATGLMSTSIERPLSLGPRMPVFMSTCLKADPTLFIFKWVTGSIATILACAIALRHSRRISEAPPTMRRLYYGRVTWFAPVLGTTATAALFSPRVYALSRFLQTQFEAVALASFGAIVFLLLASEAVKQITTKDSSLAVKIMVALNKDGPKPHFAVPPFACCFKRCIPAHLLKPSHVLLSRFLVRQYMFSAVIGSLTTLWFALAMTNHAFRLEEAIVSKFIKLSGFAAIYGLFIMYFATHDLLHKWNVTAKFISLKIIVLLSTLQETLIGLLIKHIKAPSKDCLADPFSPSKEVQDIHREHFNSMWLTALESLLVALLVSRAFPCSELYNIEDENTTQYVEMQLESLSKNGEDGYDEYDSQSESEVE